MHDASAPYAGVDGGGTRTRLVLADAFGHVMGRGQGGSTNYDDIGYEAARDHLKDALAAAWSNAGRPPVPLRAIFLGMAGVVSAKDRDAIRRMTIEIGAAAPGAIDVDHDLRTALAGGRAGAPGIVLIVGTGSACYGRRADGAAWRAGGWGALLDDIGSAYDLGLQAIIATTRAVDGRAAPTVLTEQVMQALGVTDPLDIMHRVYVEQMGKSEIGELGPLVTAAAEDGDAVAREILLRGATELSLMVATVAERLALEPQDQQIVFAGSVVHAAPHYRLMIEEAIRSRIPEARFHEPRLEPVLGAVILAMEHAGEQVNESVIGLLSQQA